MFDGERSEKRRDEKNEKKRGEEDKTAERRKEKSRKIRKTETRRRDAATRRADPFYNTISNPKMDRRSAIGCPKPPGRKFGWSCRNGRKSARLNKEILQWLAAFRDDRNLVMCASERPGTVHDPEGGRTKPDRRRKCSEVHGVGMSCSFDTYYASPVCAHVSSSV